MDSPQGDLLMVCRFLVCTSLDYSDPPVFHTYVCIQGLQIAGYWDGLQNLGNMALFLVDDNRAICILAFS